MKWHNSTYQNSIDEVTETLNKLKHKVKPEHIKIVAIDNGTFVIWYMFKNRLKNI